MTDPDFVLTVDGKSVPPGFACGSGDLAPNLVLHMPADVLHRVWLSEIRLRDAYSSGQIKVEGPLVRAFALIEPFSPARGPLSCRAAGQRSSSRHLAANAES